MTRQIWRESKWNFLKRKLSVVEIKTHTRASLHIHEQVHTQNELNNQAEERSSKLREGYEDIIPKRSRDTRGIIFKYERVKTWKTEWGSLTHLFWVPEQRWDRWERQDLKKPWLKIFRNKTNQQTWILRFRKCNKWQSEIHKKKSTLGISYKNTEYQEPSGF